MCVCIYARLHLSLSLCFEERKYEDKIRLRSDRDRERISLFTREKRKKERKKRGGNGRENVSRYRTGCREATRRLLSSSPSFPLAREDRGCVFRRASPSRRGHSANFSIIPPPPPISSSAGTQDRIIFETSMILEIDNCFPRPPSTRLIRAEG